MSILLATPLFMGSLAFAAPPRFSTFGRPSTPASESATQQDTVSQDQSTTPQLNQEQSAAANTHQTDAGKTKVEFIDGKLVTTPVTADPSPITASQTEPGNNSASPESVAMTKEPAAEATKKRQPLIRFGRRKPLIPKEKTHKQNEELVTTQEYHESEVEILGMADTHRYLSGFQEFWKVNTSKVMCSMKQAVPGYGHVEFRQGVGQPLEFALYVTYPPAGVGHAHIRTEPPEWRHYASAKDLGIIRIEPGDLAVSTPPDWANRLLLELREGMQPVLRYWDAADGSDSIEVFISSLNFQQSLDLFNRCLGQMLRYDFDTVKRTIVHFHVDSSKLRPKAKRQLDEVMEFLKEDEKIKHIDLELYTHKQGLVRYNFRLATRRARAIRDYFMERGVDEDKITIKIHTHKKAKLDDLGYKTTDVHIVLRRNKSN
jgi:outer membrane protein OmpA-like peptidoglycan-associated protein